MRKLTVVAVLAVLVLVPLGTRSMDDIDLGENFYQISEEIVSRHVKWAKPLAGGPIKTLFIGPRRAMREAVELTQRIDLDYDAVIIHSPTVLGHPTNRAIFKGANEADTIKRLNDKLAEELDLIVIGKVNAETLPIEIRQIIVDKIKNGTGLLYVYPDKVAVDSLKELETSKTDAGFPVNLVPVKAIAPFNGSDNPDQNLLDSIKTYQLENGRIVTLKYPRYNPVWWVCLTTDPLMPHYEYQQAILARLALIAAGRNPRINDMELHIVRQETPSSEVSIVEQQMEAGPIIGFAREMDVTWNLKVSGTPAESISGKLTADIIVRDERNQIEIEKTIPITALDTAIAADLPLGKLKEGGHFCDVIIKSSGKSLGFGSTYFTADSPISVVSLITDKEYYEIGDMLKGRITLNKKLGSRRKAVVSLRDNYQRVVWQQELSQENAKIVLFQISLGKPLTILHTLYAEVREGETVLSRKVKEIPVAMRGLPDNFSFAGWGYASPTSHLTSIQSKVLRRLGLDTRSNGGFGKTDVYGMAKGNMQSIPYSWIVEFWGSPGVTERSPCLTDSAYREKERKRFHTRAKQIQPYGVLAYTLGDETYYNLYDDGVCYSPSCRDNFRDFLKNDYGTIEALNDEWKTDYSDWDDLLNIKSAGDLPKNNAAPRGDHWRYIDWVMTDAHKFARRTIREIDTGALVGLDGTESLYASTGIYWYDLMNAIDMINVYPYNTWPQKVFNRHCVRSFLRPGMYSGMWYGGYTSHREEKYQRFFPWYSLLFGFNSIWWYDTGVPGENFNALAPDFSPVDSFRQTTEEIREIKSGVGKLIMGSKRLDDKIAIHYSQRSFHLDSLLRDPILEREPGRYVQELTEFINIILDLGLQFNMVATEQIEAGELIEKSYKVFIMPCSRALTEKEKSAITEFVEQGGVVIADLFPGVRDAHLVPVKKWDFGKLFGLMHIEIAGTKVTEGKAEAYAKLREVTDLTFGIVRLFKEIDGLKADLTLANRPSSGAVKHPESSAEHLGNVNRTFLAGVINKYGSGKTLYLNFPIAGYWEDRYIGCERDLREFFRQVITWAGVEIPITVTVDKKPAGATEIVRFANSDELYISVWQDPYIASEKENKAVMNIPGRKFIYDMRRARYIGYTSRVSFNLKPGRAEVFALLPCKIDSVAFDLDSKIVAAGSVLEGSIKLNAKQEISAPHIINIKAFGPDGTEKEYYMHNVEAAAGSAKYEFKTAFNDEKGKWKIVARDTVSGKTKTVSFNIN